MRLATLAALSSIALVAAACSRRPALETRTFALHYLSQGEAGELVKPYVYLDRPGAAGALSATESAITVRETPDNLDKIARMLQQYDHPAPNVRLHFQVILADGAAPVDSSIAPVVAQLRKLFRFQGYRLVTQAQVTGTEHTSITQALNGGPALGGMLLRVVVGSIRGSADSTVAEVSVRLQGSGGLSELQTEIGARVGQTMVLGSTQFSGHPGTVILTVRPALVED